MCRGVILDRPVTLVFSPMYNDRKINRLVVVTKTSSWFHSAMKESTLRTFVLKYFFANSILLACACKRTSNEEQLA